MISGFFFNIFSFPSFCCCWKSEAHRFGCGILDVTSMVMVPKVMQGSHGACVMLLNSAHGMDLRLYANALPLSQP